MKVRKVIAGFIAGVLFATSATAYGEEIILIGKQIQGQTTVYNDGQVLDTAIIVDGKSYAPVRSIAEATGKEVDFTEGEIHLLTPESVPVDEPFEEPNEQPVDDPAPSDEEEGEGDVQEIEKQLKGLNGRIEMLSMEIYTTKILAESGSDRQKSEAAAKLPELEAELAKLQQDKAELEAKIAEQA